MDAEYRAELLRRFGKAVEDLSPVELEQLMDYIRALRQSGTHSSCEAVSCETLIVASALGVSETDASALLVSGFAVSSGINSV